MKIVVDVMGSDRGCEEMTRGVCDAVKEYGIEAVAVGDEKLMAPVVSQYGIDGRIRLVNVPEYIRMDEDSHLVRTAHAGCSMVEAMKLLSAGEADAFVTAGSTGAAITAATLYVKRIRGIRRAALAPTIPSKDGGALLIDCGANADCTPEYLLQFAYMGYYYAEAAFGRKNPRVGLLNVGTEDTKGDALRKETFPLLKEAGAAGRINFVGNIESRDVLYGAADVIVSDGFAGNVLLKSMEGVGMFFLEQMKGVFLKNARTKLGAALVKKDLYEMKKIMNYREVGGSPLVGVQAPVIKAHGSADAFTMKNAISQAMRYTEGNIVGKITANIDNMKIAGSPAE